MTADLDRSFERGLRESAPGPGICDTPDGGPVTSAGLFAGFCGRKAANSPSQLMANLIIYRVPEVEGNWSDYFPSDTFREENRLVTRPQALSDRHSLPKGSLRSPLRDRRAAPRHRS